MQRSRIDGQERKEAAERMQSGFLGLELKMPSLTLASFSNSILSSVY